MYLGPRITFLLVFCMANGFSADQSEKPLMTSESFVEYSMKVASKYSATDSKWDRLAKNFNDEWTVKILSPGQSIKITDHPKGKYIVLTSDNNVILDGSKSSSIPKDQYWHPWLKGDRTDLLFAAELMYHTIVGNSFLTPMQKDVNKRLALGDLAALTSLMSFMNSQTNGQFQEKLLEFNKKRAGQILELLPSELAELNTLLPPSKSSTENQGRWNFFQQLFNTVRFSREDFLYLHQKNKKNFRVPLAPRPVPPRRKNPTGRTPSPIA